MRPELLTIARRELLADLLEAAALDEATRDLIETPVREMLYRFVVRLDTYDCDRRAASVLAAFTLMQIWPEALERPVLAIANAGEVSTGVARLKLSAHA